MLILETENSYKIFKLVLLREVKIINIRIRTPAANLVSDIY